MLRGSTELYQALFQPDAAFRGQDGARLSALNAVDAAVEEASTSYWAGPAMATRRPARQYSREAAKPVLRGSVWHEGVEFEAGKHVAISHLGSEFVVLPLWVAVRQTQPNKAARVLLSTRPVDDALAAALDGGVAPGGALGGARASWGGGGARYTVEGLTFGQCDERRGDWANYLVALAGDVACCQDQTMWPNQAFHGRRARFNLRDVYDLAAFVAEPQHSAMREHAAALQALAADRGYRPGYVARQLALRWGCDALDRCGMLPR